MAVRQLLPHRSLAFSPVVASYRPAGQELRTRRPKAAVVDQNKQHPMLEQRLLPALKDVRQSIRPNAQHPMLEQLHLPALKDVRQSLRPNVQHPMHARLLLLPHETRANDPRRGLSSLALHQSVQEWPLILHQSVQV